MKDKAKDKTKDKNKMTDRLKDKTRVGTRKKDLQHEGRAALFLDEDRMVNEGMGGGYITDDDNAYIGETTTDSMAEPESVISSD